MYDIFENGDDCIQVDGGGGVEQAEAARVDAGSRVAIVAAVDASNPGSGGVAESDNDSGYQVVTRAKGRKARNTKTVRNDNGPTTIFQFAQPVETSKKRRAEEQIGKATKGASVNEQIAGLRTLLVQLIDQNEAREVQIQQQTQEIQALRSEIEGLRKLLQQKQGSRATYAAAVCTDIPGKEQADRPQSSSRDSQPQSQRMRVEDDKCAITINTARFKGEKTDFILIKAALQSSIDTIDVLQGIRIKCLRQLPGERINVVFASEAEAQKARDATARTALKARKVSREGAVVTVRYVRRDGRANPGRRDLAVDRGSKRPKVSQDLMVFPAMMA